MLAFVVEGSPSRSRIARVKEFNVNIQTSLGHIIDEVDISDPSRSATGANNTVSY